MKIRLTNILSILVTIGGFNLFYKKMDYSLTTSIIGAIIVAIILTMAIDFLLLKKK